MELQAQREGERIYSSENVSKSTFYRAYWASNIVLTLRGVMESRLSIVPIKMRKRAKFNKTNR